MIKKAMDLGTVKKNFGSKPSRCRFKSQEKFAKDVRLVFQNALLYNKDDEHVKGSVYDAAQHLLRVFEMAYAKSKETVFKDDNECMTESQNGANKDSLVMNERKLSWMKTLNKRKSRKINQTKKKKSQRNPNRTRSRFIHQYSIIASRYRILCIVYGVQKKLRNRSYSSLDAFAYDFDRLFCMRICSLRF